VELGSPIAFRSVSLGKSCYNNTLTAAWKVALGGSDLDCVGSKPKSRRRPGGFDCWIVQSWAEGTAVPKKTVPSTR